jgi:hypothetical protein
VCACVQVLVAVHAAAHKQLTEDSAAAVAAAAAAPAGGAGGAAAPADALAKQHTAEQVAAIQKSFAALVSRRGGGAQGASGGGFRCPLGKRVLEQRLERLHVCAAASPSLFCPSAQAHKVDAHIAWAVLPSSNKTINRAGLAHALSTGAVEDGNQIYFVPEGVKNIKVVNGAFALEYNAPA